MRGDLQEITSERDNLIKRDAPFAQPSNIKQQLRETTAGRVHLAKANTTINSQLITSQRQLQNITNHRDRLETENTTITTRLRKIERQLQATTDSRDLAITQSLDFKRKLQIATSERDAAISRLNGIKKELNDATAKRGHHLDPKEAPAVRVRFEQPAPRHSINSSSDSSNIIGADKVGDGANNNRTLTRTDDPPKLSAPRSSTQDAAVKIQELTSLLANKNLEIKDLKEMEKDLQTERDNRIRLARVNEELKIALEKLKGWWWWWWRWPFWGSSVWQ